MTTPISCGKLQLLAICCYREILGEYNADIDFLFWDASESLLSSRPNSSIFCAALSAAESNGTKSCNVQILLLNLGMEQSGPPLTISSIQQILPPTECCASPTHCRAFVGAAFGKRTPPCCHTIRSIPNRVLSDPDACLGLGSLRLHL